MYIPTPYIFLAGGIIALLTLIPIVIILRANLEAYKERKEELEGEGDYETDINHD